MSFMIMAAPNSKLNREIWELPLGLAGVVIINSYSHPLLIQTDHRDFVT